MVTGAATGIGAAVARQLVAEGASVGLVGLQPEELNSLAAQLNEVRAGSALAVTADVSDAEQVEAAVAQIVAEFGKVDLCVNNAGVPGQEADLHLIDPADWNRTLAINLGGTYNGMRFTIPHMLAAGGGAIVNIGSVQATKPLSQHGAYTASKYGIIGLTGSAALDYVGQGIRVNAVSPGVTDTPMVAGGGELAEFLKTVIPAGRMASPAEVANAVLYALSDRASYLVGQEIIVDGGFVLR
jgi:NAD(P)-dependent dehydrogenase (short-subunit alcohol dehydrogenase family)